MKTNVILIESVTYRLFVSSLVGGLLLGLANASPAQAGNKNVRSDQRASCGGPGKVFEESEVPANFIVHFTDKNSQIVPKFDRFLKGRFSNGAFRAETFFGGAPGICDAVNDTILLKDDPGEKPGAGPDGIPGNEDDPQPGPDGWWGTEDDILEPGPDGEWGTEDDVIRKVGARSSLWIESLVINSETGLVEIEGIFARLEAILGRNVRAKLPDVYADTNGDGVIGEGDWLYSLIDLNIFLRNPFDFQLGDTVEIVDGRIDGLDGMIFSDMPFMFNPENLATGFDFLGRPYTGQGEIKTQHELEAVPEPSMVLGALVMGGITIASRRSRRRG